MRTILWSTLALVAGLSVAGCQGKPGARANEPATTPLASPAIETGKEHAGAGAVPGSYEDWCGEHGVAETACTRCDPSLIPAYQAVGDWDEEHGLPKSQCLRCEPNLKIVRPPKPETE